jgi:excisionase family DNA binding protein
MDTQTTETAILAVPENKPLTAEAAAAFLGLTKGYLYKLVESKKISCHQPGGKILYFRKEDLEKYAFRNRIASRYELREKAETILNGAR